VTAGNGCMAQASTRWGVFSSSPHLGRAMNTNQNKTSLSQAIAYSILIFCGPVFLIFLFGLFGDVKQLLTEGYIWRGGTFETCVASDFDPRYGRSCDGVEYIEQPLEAIPLTQAIGENVLSTFTLFLALMPIALFFGFSYYQQNKKEKP